MKKLIEVMVDIAMLLFLVLACTFMLIALGGLFLAWWRN